MPRAPRRHLALVLALAFIACLVTGASGVSAAASKSHPPLLDYWSVYGPYAGAYGVIDRYGGRLNRFYPELGATDTIPAVTATMHLAPGMTLGKSTFCLLYTSDAADE